MRKREPTNYDDIAEGYAPVADEMLANKYWERPATLRLLPKLKGVDVLDAGCGAGFYSEHACSEGARVVGFDPSADMVAYARNRLGDKVELHHCTTDQLPALLGDRKFDLILSCLVLHYVRALAAEMKMLADLLRPAGKIIISMRHPYMYPPRPGVATYQKSAFLEAKWDCGAVTTIHRPLWKIAEAFRLAGLVIHRMDEPQPDPALETADPDTWRRSQSYPLFIHFVLGLSPKSQKLHARA
jgi:SAM-dependent methyltransferase